MMKPKDVLYILFVKSLMKVNHHLSCLGKNNNIRKVAHLNVYD